MSNSNNKPKVLYIGHYRQSSGWGQAARDYILAMDSVGVDVVCRAIVLNGATSDIPERILELENKSSKGCDVCIQHVLPHYMVAGPFKKNIGMYATETNDFTHSGWQNYINLMDEAIVFCKHSEMASINSGVDYDNMEIHVVPHTFKTEEYSNPRKKIDGLETTDFLFYFIGEYNQRKNIPALLRAFHAEFDPSEPVNVLLKVNSPIFSPPQLMNEIQRMSGKIKEDLRLYPSINDYKQELIITDYIDRETLLDLHYSCDCFVCPSFGEAWCIPAFEAMAFGKFPVCTNVGGMADYIENDSTGWKIDGTPSPCSGLKDTFDGLFTGKDTWTSINIEELGKKMRRAYNLLKSVYRKKSIEMNSKAAINNYSYGKIGQQLKEIISG